MRKCSTRVLLLNARSGEVLVPASGAPGTWASEDTSRAVCSLSWRPYKLVPRELMRLVAGRMEAMPEKQPCPL